MPARSSPARLYAGAAGAALALAGIIGFFYSADFGSPGDVEALSGVLDVNGWQNLLHILTGALGLIAFGAALNARRYAIAVGTLYVLLAVWGVIAGSGASIAGIVPVNPGENLAHVAIGLAGLYAGFATAPDRASRA